MNIYNFIDLQIPILFNFNLLFNKTKSLIGTLASYYVYRQKIRFLFLRKVNHRSEGSENANCTNLFNINFLTYITHMVHTYFLTLWFLIGGEWKRRKRIKCLLFKCFYAKSEFCLSTYCYILLVLCWDCTVY